MGRSGLVVVVILLAQAGLAFGQDLPSPLPEDAPHAAVLADQQYPSAKQCGECHPNQFRQWSISSHAYANLSPMFNKFEQKINDLASGTIGHFCVRCHASVGTALGERRDIAWWDRSAASREGITCVTCHRVGDGYGKTNAARRITPGSIHEAVFGPFDTTGGIEAISRARELGIVVSPDQPDRPAEADGKKWIRMHQAAVQSDFIKQSEFCVACHQVQVHPGIKLETVWEEYRNSPAAKEGITCQQCHMSTVPGQNTGYATGWAARVNNQYVNTNRPLTDHTFVGPGYPISHPGLFPFRLDEAPFTPQQWLKFDYRAKWGSDEFENRSASSTTFPPEWQNAADRRTAWKVVQENLGRWEERKQMRLKLLEGGSRLDGPYFDGPPTPGRPLSFHYRLTNLNKGHNLPSGSLGAQPELWVNVALIDPDGKRVWESGYLDSYGDMADVQSRDVRERKIAYDHQLVNMQAKFITTNVKGTDREMYLPINLDVDQLPFIRPGGTPTSLLNHPPFARMEKRSIPPLGTRDAKYKVPAELLTKPGTYRLAIRMRGRTEPIYFMDFVGATTDMKWAEAEWVTDTHIYAVEFDVGGGGGAHAAADHGTSEHPHDMSPGARIIEVDPVAQNWFGPDPRYDDQPYDAEAQLEIYSGKYVNKTAEPPVELGIRLYDRGAYTPRPTWLGRKNPIMFHFLAYGDLRLAGAVYDNGPVSSGEGRDQSVIAARLNLEMDMALTATERLHAFVRPLDKNNSFTRYQINGPGEGDFVEEFDFDLNTLFFEGDVGAITQGLTDRNNLIDLPFALGRVPLFTQNGIWLDDAIDGFAFGITAKNSPRLDVPNTDLTFFVGLDNVDTGALGPAADGKVFGIAGFADARQGYLEYGYGYVDADDNDLSYHNLTAAFTKRYWGRLNNSVRVIGNVGQNGSSGFKTAEGVLLLVENSIIPRYTPYGSKYNVLNFVPYVNFFAGFDSPQPLARAADSGGVLKNTGINFESDGLTAYPTLDARGREAFGGALGLEYLFDLSRQIVLEAAVVQHNGDDLPGIGNEYALGVRYQHKVGNAWIVRADAMKGWRQGQDDVYGVRLELRRKF